MRRKLLCQVMIKTGEILGELQTCDDLKICEHFFSETEIVNCGTILLSILPAQSCVHFTCIKRLQTLRRCWSKEHEHGELGFQQIDETLFWQKYNETFCLSFLSNSVGWNIMSLNLWLPRVIFYL